MPVAARWTASLEYLFTAYGAKSVAFPAGAQRFESDLAIQSVRMGLNYQFGDQDAKRTGPAPPNSNNWSVHAQSTYVQQYAFPFHAPYAGQNSLVPGQTRETWDATFYVGWRLWRGAELWINPEIDQGFGLSGTLGVAGYVSGEAYKLGANYPYTRLPRTFIRQTIDLGGASEKVEAAPNQLAGSQTANRLVFTVGKFSVTDVFDTNKYAHDARSDFLNWALIDTGSFDYASDAWGFTYGAAVEWYQGPWTFRGGLFDLSIVPNSTELDPSFEQVQWVGEIERRYELWGKPGKLAVTGFLTRGRMGSFEDAIRLAQLTGLPADIAAVRQYRSRTGLSFNLEQQLASDLGVFARGGFASGNVEPYEFTDVDSTIAAGIVLCRQALGPARRHHRPRRRDQRHLGQARSLPQRRRPRHPGGRRQAAQSRHRADRRGLLQPAGDEIFAADLRLPAHRQPRLQPGPRSGVRHRHAPARAVLTARSPGLAHAAHCGRQLGRGEIGNKPPRWFVGYAPQLSLAVAEHALPAGKLEPSVRQFEPVALGGLLAARWLGRRLRLALAAHARKDDDLGTRCFGGLARLWARVPRTEVENHGHCVPLAAALRPGLPHRTTRTKSHGESPHLTATGVNGLLMCGKPATRGQAASQSSRKWRPWRSSTDTIQMSGSNSIWRAR